MKVHSAYPPVGEELVFDTPHGLQSKPDFSDMRQDILTTTDISRNLSQCKSMHVHADLDPLSQLWIPPGRVHLQQVFKQLKGRQRLWQRCICW